MCWRFPFDIIARVIQLYRKRQEEKRLEQIRRFTDLSTAMNQANCEFEAFLSGNAYFTYPQMENWKSKHESLYRQRKSIGSISGLRLDPSVTDATDQFDEYYRNISDLRDSYNRDYTAAEKTRFKDMFDNIEGRVMDDQQRGCIVKDEVSNLVIAGAGSGKTTTIVGKVKYLLAKGYKEKPDEILVLSFTNASAREMAERIRKETTENIDVMTFHKLGKEIIADVEGKQPTVTRINLNDYITERFLQLLNIEDYMRLVKRFFFSYLKEYKSQFDFTNHGDYITYLKNCAIRTIKDEAVKSFEELEIANFLTLNGVEYEYERPYQVDTADRRFGIYRPDFYLPEYGIYIEHFGIDRDGNVPPFFSADGLLSAKEKYNLDIRWKRELHKKHDTVLVETYSYENREGVLLDSLSSKLQAKGVRFRPLGMDKVLGLIRRDNSRELDSLIGLVNTFIVLLKANGFSIEQVMDKNRRDNQGYQLVRSEVFLRLVDPIYNEYNRQLEENDEIDFSDMINKACDYVLAGRFNKKYTYILVDEYQDISMPRYKLIKALRDRHRAKLFCVGDDWQSIYRFAGSEVDLFHRFEHYFGYAERSLIETTYRFNSSIIEVSSHFIMKNRAQIHKNLNSYGSDNTQAFEVIYADSRLKLASRFEELLSALPRGSSVLLLGRYNEDIRFVLGPNLKVRHLYHESKDIVTYLPRKDLQIEFLTIHRSKGLQADYVFILNNAEGKYGFPSNIADDKVLNLVIHAKELFEHAEERRLFYVALTRAKKHVYLLVENNNKSVFVRELERDGFASGDTSAVERCPLCRTGDLVMRRGRFGEFYGCSNYPWCEYTRRVGGRGEARVSSTRQ